MASKALLSDAKTVIEDWLDPSEVNLDVQILLVGGAMGLCLVGLLHNLLTIIETLNGLLIGTLMVMGVWQAIVRRPTLFSLDRAVRRRVPATASDCMLHGSATVLFAAGWAIVQLPIIIEWFSTTEPTTNPSPRGLVAIVLAAGLVFGVLCFIASAAVGSQVRFRTISGAAGSERRGLRDS